MMPSNYSWAVVLTVVVLASAVSPNHCSGQSPPGYGGTVEVSFHLDASGGVSVGGPSLSLTFASLTLPADCTGPVGPPLWYSEASNWSLTNAVPVGYNIIERLFDVGGNLVNYDTHTQEVSYFYDDFLDTGPTERTVDLPVSPLGFHLGPVKFGVVPSVLLKYNVTIDGGRHVFLDQDATIESLTVGANSEFIYPDGSYSLLVRNQIDNTGIFRKIGNTTVNLPLINNTGTVEVLSGTLNLSGGGTSSGRFYIAPAGQVVVSAGAGLTMADGAEIENAGTMALEGSWTSVARLGVEGDVTLRGGGLMELAGTYSWNNWIGTWSTGRLINEDNTIRGGGIIGGQSMPMSLTNHGVVEADAATLAIYAGTGGMVNTGTLRAVNGATLYLSSGTFTNSGALIDAQDGSTVSMGNATVTGGTVQAEGTGQISVSNSAINGAPVTLWGPGQLWLYNGSILGGAVGNLGGGAVRVLGGDNRLSEPLTNAVGGQVVVSAGAGLTMADGAEIENAGRMALEGNGYDTGWGWRNLLARLEMEGDVTLRGGGVMELGGTYPRNNRIGTASTGRLINEDNTIRGGGIIGWPTIPAGLTNHGVVEADNSAAALTIYAGTGGMVNTGTLRAVNGATLELKDGTFANSGLVDVQSALLSISGEFTQTAGATRLNNGTITSTTALKILGGSVEGTGHILADILNQGGIVSPGFSPGTLTIDGDYTQGHDATLLLEIAGLQPGQFDVFNVTGTARLDGLLKIAFLDDFQPVTGDTFAFFNYGVRIGEFDSIFVGGLPGYEFIPLYGIDGLTLRTSVVPLPTSVWLGALGLLASLCCMYRHEYSEDAS